jgi:hypothetical protein
VNRRKTRKQGGAVLVEWIIVATAFCLLLGCMFAIRAYCSLQLARLDEAREDAWAQAMNGCDASAPNLSEVGEKLKAGEGPAFAKQMLPSGRNASRTFESSAALPVGFGKLTGRREVRFVCNPFPGKAVPTSNLIDWLKEWL